ncbi:MAG: hypothetical protein AAF125_01425, partial [Chloroflexota bacterium]
VVSREIDGRTFNVIRYDSENANGAPTFNIVIAVEYSDGAKTYITGTHTETPPPTFFADVLAIAVSMDRQ